MGEQLSNQFSVGFVRMARTIRERMNVRDNEVFTPVDLMFRWGIFKGKDVALHDDLDLILFLGRIVGDYMAFNGLSVYQEGLDAFLGVIFVGDFDLVGCTSVLTGNGEAFHIRGDAGIYGQSVQGRIDAQDVLGNIDKGPGCRTGEPAVLRFAEVSGILSGYHLRVNIRLCPVDLTDVFNVGRAGLFIYFESTVSVADDSLADRDPRIVVTENTGIFLV